VNYFLKANKIFLLTR